MTNSNDELQHETADLKVVIQQLHDLAHFVESPTWNDMEAPTTFGKYRVIDEIGQGGQAILYLAYDPEAQRSVIIKWYVGSTIGDHASILDEARALCSLEHEHIVRCIDVSLQDHHAFLVLQPITGRSLGHVLSTRRPGPEESLEWMIGVCEAIQALHDRGWVHGDISPRNILISQTGQPILIDFGLAKRLACAADSDTDTDAASNTCPSVATDLAALHQLLAQLCEACDEAELSPRSRRLKLALQTRFALQRDLTCPSLLGSASQFATGLLDLREREQRRRRRHRWFRKAAAAVAAGLLLTGTVAAAQFVWNHPLGFHEPRPSWIQTITMIDETTDEQLVNSCGLQTRVTGIQPDEQGNHHLAAGESVTLELSVEQRCKIAIYAISKDSNKLVGSLIHLTPSGTLSLVPGEVTRVPLETFYSDGQTEWIYLVGQPNAWDPTTADDFQGSIRFQRIDINPHQWARGVVAKPSLSEALIPLVVHHDSWPQEQCTPRTVNMLTLSNTKLDHRLENSVTATTQ